jgi:peptide deformylase
VRGGLNEKLSRGAARVWRDTRPGESPRVIRAHMAVLQILTVPNPLLTKKCRPVGPGEFGEELARFVSDLAETMYAAPGVGLAAPQCGDLRRVIVVDPGNCTREQDDDGRPTNPRFLALVNPQIIEASSDKMVYEEGCLSVPDFEENIARPRRVHIRYLDERGVPWQRWFEGYDAIVVQHEMDHLEGVVILDRVSRMKKGRYLAKRTKVRVRADGSLEY